MKPYQYFYDIFLLQTSLYQNLFFIYLIVKIFNMKYNFKVIECSWDTFTKQLGQATSLDDIIAAHTYFINTVSRGTLLDEKSQVSVHLSSSVSC